MMKELILYRLQVQTLLPYDFFLLIYFKDFITFFDKYFVTGGQEEFHRTLLNVCNNKLEVNLMVSRTLKLNLLSD